MVLKQSNTDKEWSIYPSSSLTGSMMTVTVVIILADEKNPKKLKNISFLDPSFRFSSDFPDNFG